jgi:hypothetical protein
MPSRPFNGRRTEDMRQVEYRGNNIRYEERVHGWVAHIRRPGGFVIMRKGIINATLDEGEEALMQLSRACIDEEEDGRINLD